MLGLTVSMPSTAMPSIDGSAAPAIVQLLRVDSVGQVASITSARAIPVVKMAVSGTLNSKVSPFSAPIRWFRSKTEQSKQALHVTGIPPGPPVHPAPVHPSDTQP